MASTMSSLFRCVCHGDVDKHHRDVDFASARFGLASHSILLYFDDAPLVISYPSAPHTSSSMRASKNTHTHIPTNLFYDERTLRNKYVRADATLLSLSLSSKCQSIKYRIDCAKIDSTKENSSQKKTKMSELRKMLETTTDEAKKSNCHASRQHDETCVNRCVFDSLTLRSSLLLPFCWNDIRSEKTWQGQRQRGHHLYDSNGE